MEGLAIKTQSKQSHTNLPSCLVLDGSKKIARHTGYYYTAGKLLYRSIDLIALFHKTMSLCWLNLSKAVRGGTELIEVTRLPFSLNELFCPNAQGVYFFKNKNNTWQRIADRVSFACHAFLKSVTAALQWGFITLGKVAKYSIGHLTVLKLVTDGFFGISSFFGAWDSLKQLRKIKATMNPENKSTQKLKNSLQMKFVVNSSKALVIPLMLTFVALQLTTFPFSLTLLTLGVIGDSTAFVRIFHDDYR